MATSIPAIEFPNKVQHLLDQRQQHAESIARIDRTLTSVLAALDGTPTAPAAMQVIEQAALTPREQQTLRHLLAGQTEAEIADVIGVSPSTVHIFIRRLYQKFRVNSRARLTAIFLTDLVGLI